MHTSTAWVSFRSPRQHHLHGKCISNVRACAACCEVHKIRFESFWITWCKLRGYFLGWVRLLASLDARLEETKQSFKMSQTVNSVRSSKCCVHLLIWKASVPWGKYWKVFLPKPWTLVDIEMNTIKMDQGSLRLKERFRFNFSISPMLQAQGWSQDRMRTNLIRCLWQNPIWNKTNSARVAVWCCLFASACLHPFDPFDPLFWDMQSSSVKLSVRNADPARMVNTQTAFAQEQMLQFFEGATQAATLCTILQMILTVVGWINKCWYYIM